MKFKELVQFKPNSRGIDYKAIDPKYDPKTNKIFSDTQIITEGGRKYIIGTYTGSLTLTTWDGALEEEVEEITIISTRAFMQRFLQPERINLRATTNPIIIDMMEDLHMAAYVNLKYKTLEPGLAYLVIKGYLPPTRVVKMLVNGTEEEKYRGLL